MANIKEYIKKVMDGTVSLEEQQAALAQVEKTIVEARQRRDEAVGQKADMVVQALKSIEAKLEAKLVELNNTPAKQGIQGPKGKDGKDGKDGLNGRDGVNGKDGKDGIDGIDGKDGISVVDAQVDFDGSLVIYLSNGNEIDAGKVLSPEVAQQVIISGNGPVTAKEVTDTLADLQNQINTLTGIDGVLGTMAQQNDSNVTITGGTLSGTKVQPRVLASTANSATPTLNTDNYDMMVITGQSVAITSFTTNLSGTPVNGQKLWISVTGTGAIALTWGASFESSTATLPTTTVSTNRLDVGFVWNVATTKWRCVAVA